MEIFQIDEEPSFRLETTRDMSSAGGVSFWSNQSLSIGREVRYRVTLSGGQSPIAIDCKGRVLRCDPARNPDAKSRYEIAVTMERYRFLASSEFARTVEEILTAGSHH
jgi:hypothetical protein